MKLQPNARLTTLLLTLAFMSASLRAGMVSPDGTLVAYAVPAYDKDANLYSEVFVSAGDGSSKRALGTVPGRRDQISWIGNDRIVLGEFAFAERCAVLDTTGERLPDVVLPSGCDVVYLAVSPDGQKVTFTGSCSVGGEQRHGLFVCDVDSGVVKLLIEKNIKSLAAWSPDSRTLAVGIGDYGKDYPLRIVDVATGQVDDTGAFGVGASWSPDGTLVACTTDIRRGGSWIAGVPNDGKLGIYEVQTRAMRVVAGTDGALRPAWSKSGNLVAYVAGGKIGIANRDGSSKALPQDIGRELPKGPFQMAWVGDEAVCILANNQLVRFDVSLAKAVTLAEWKEPAVPELKPEDFKTFELPRVTVTYARFDRKYAEAFGNILAEALNVYESLGFKMPPKVNLEACIDPQATQLWTDGESRLYLDLKSKELLAPAYRTGVFNLYGMCHELGHVAMYRSLESNMGLPQGVAEGWAHYAGCIVITEVAAKLGTSIWPESYDVAEVEGIGRLVQASAEARSWEKMDETSRAALAFYRMETECGRDKLAAAMTAALAERPTGKELLPLLLAKLRQATANPTAANWVPESVLVPRTEWKTKERLPGDDFFADQKVEPDGPGLWLYYDDGTMEDKQSISGCAETVLFRLPEGAWLLDGIKLYSARYGEDEPPEENVSLYLCDESFELLREVKIAYSNFEKGDEKWHTVSFAPIPVPKTFYLGIDFHATATKGVYVAKDTSVRRSHSRLAMPYSYVDDMKGTADWMLRVHLRPRP
ncbi:MAG TPA: hypothetical protein PKM43_00965 [Verrucomicrobiota bacterium]|nr:hypothetical protein [Verrucomicrobiota bacterium]HRZ36310.1 hypothetical protein [Candidatus Paceibacterota bacterium]HRZ53926.1 hypothetical protein [Candidatus Paceibacterota bacterium]